ncbi:metal-dependent hydrolase [Gemmata obscuriglobus]|uniref:MBL fold metallo-hydrolase n=1 Tax=Gemmata obscuriglobus TaxID=114 RepID=UPI00016C57B4|nr:MBL fold metallo-hydrolase [Gemmata obscuriglobus]QEG25893.1 metal-dependent hydrolase [Gemmata obscuriglobus]VTR99957.1 Zn-dependent hydrolase of the beta-lactamase fold-like protein OS=Clostridium cellulovorans (strain ATCC 35296 / DSM 3052 / OCM 3 / 743B) GN=Clocel_4328 PE=4 SV=1: Lactamase_B_3 [Gemmata obscuriglobus UQM 2246]
MTRLFASAALLAALLSAALTAPSSRAAGQEPKDKSIKIRWLGQSFFQIESAEGRLIAIDPHGIPAFGRPIIPAEFVLVSHSHEDHALVEFVEAQKKDTKLKEADIYRGVVETKPGKQEWKTYDEKRGSIRVRNVATYHDTVNGMQRGKNSIWIIEMNGLVLCHLGDLGHELTAEQVKAIGKVDVLMVPVGGIYTINGEQAQKVTEQIKPRLYALPMHYGVPGYEDLAGPDEFLDGVKKERVTKTPDTNELVIPIDAKAEEYQIVLLGWRKGEAKKK